MLTDVGLRRYYTDVGAALVRPLQLRPPSRINAVPKVSHYCLCCLFVVCMVVFYLMLWMCLFCCHCLSLLPQVIHAAASGFQISMLGCRGAAVACQRLAERGPRDRLRSSPARSPAAFRDDRMGRTLCNVMSPMSYNMTGFHRLIII